MIKDFLKSRRGQILISIIWGIGLAALFRRGCANNKCLIIKGTKSRRGFSLSIQV